MVRKSMERSEVSDALRWRSVCSVGMESVLSGWPGRSGQAVVEGSDGSWTSLEPSSSY
jgi:hypothetical protein